MFAYVTGTGPDDVRLAGLGLTRMAPEGSLVVNSSRGGGAKDTWIVGEPDADEARSGLMCGLSGEIRFDGRSADVAACGCVTEAMAAPRARTGPGCGRAGRSRSGTGGCRSSTSAPPAASRWWTPRSA